MVDDLQVPPGPRVRVGFKLGQVNRWGYTRHRAGAAELVFAAASSAATADWQPAAAQQRN